MMKICVLTAIMATSLLMISGCGSADKHTASEMTMEASSRAQDNVIQDDSNEDSMTVDENEKEMLELVMSIDGVEVQVEWEDNEPVHKLRKLVEEGNIRIETSAYGGFEQVGAIGESLPTKDVRTTTQAGDIMLYTGSQIVVFYGSNSWSYTRLGKIIGMSDEELEAMLEKSKVLIEISKRK